MAKSKDLFDDTTMTFGEHLEALRTHLIRALLGLVIVMGFTLAFGNRLVDIIRTPIDQALRRNALAADDTDIKEFEQTGGFWGRVKSFMGFPDTDHEKAAEVEKTLAEHGPSIEVKVKPSELIKALHAANPQAVPPPAAAEKEEPIPLTLSAPEFAVFRKTADQINRPVTLNVQEAFLMYLKVALVGGLVLSGPWILYQLWQFVAAGLYPHERKYVYVFLPLSVGLFLFGAFFCFKLALPLVLDFLLSYNRWLGVVPQIRLSEWVSFVVILPLMFGISFQLPIVLLFLERIGIFTVQDYREKRRLAILVIAISAMLLSPGGDPGSMMLMFLPLVVLYEFGIVLCGFLKFKPPVEEEAFAS